jgi:hypothetical protein
MSELSGMADRAKVADLELRRHAAHPDPQKDIVEAMFQVESSSRARTLGQKATALLVELSRRGWVLMREEDL